MGIEVDEEEDIQALLSEPETQANSPGYADDLLCDLSDLVKPSEARVEIPLEDAAWVDSCISFDSVLSEDGWQAFRNSMFDALGVQNLPSAGFSDPEIQGIQPSSTSSKGSLVSEDFTMEEDMDEGAPVVYSTRLAVSSVEDESASTDGHVKEFQASEDFVMTEEQDEGLKALHASRLVDSDDVEGENEYIDELGDGLEAPESRQSIFKVWDLETSYSAYEEDGLNRDLQKMLKTSGTLDHTVPNYSTDTVGTASLDELVLSMGDLSLHQEKR